MNQTLSLLTLGIALSVLLGAAAPAAWAEEEGTVLRGETERFVPQPPPVSNLFGRATLDENDLAGQRGGADSHLSEIRAIGSVSEVSASDLVTGHNIVTDRALAGASGMPMFIQNSGNGVLIQNAVIVNVEIN